MTDCFAPLGLQSILMFVPQGVALGWPVDGPLARDEFGPRQSVALPDAWIFVSHSLRDLEKVRELRNELERRGHNRRKGEG